MLAKKKSNKYPQADSNPYEALEATRNEIKRRFNAMKKAKEQGAPHYVVRLESRIIK